MTEALHLRVQGLPSDASEVAVLEVLGDVNENLLKGMRNIPMAISRCS